MALPSRNHTLPTTSANHHHHHHPPHHYRKKRGGVNSGLYPGAVGGPSGTAAGPLRQLLVDQEEEAGAMGGGSSRDASEEDNDAFSEQSDSASSVPHALSEALSSPTHFPRGIPTTARDRALVDSKAHRHNYTNVFAGNLPPAGQKIRANLPEHAAATSIQPANRLSAGTSSNNVFTNTSSSSVPCHQPTRKSFSNAKDPAVAATLAQAAAALSSSSSNDLSRYAADDEDKSSESVQMGRANSIDSTSTDDRFPSRMTNRPAGGPLSLQTFPEPISLATSAEASTPRPPYAPGSASTTNPLLSSTNLQRQGSSYIGSEAESEAQSTTSPFSHRETQKATTIPRNVEGDDGDASDGGTASPYDGDVEFAARAPASQQVVNSLQHFNASRAATVVSTAVQSPSSAFSDVFSTISAPRPAATEVADETSIVKDVPCRVYAATGGSNIALGYSSNNVLGSDREEIDSHRDTSTYASPTVASSSSAIATDTSQVTIRPSPSEIHSHLIRLNSPHLITRLLSQAAGVDQSASASASASGVSSVTTSSTEHLQTGPVRIFVQTIFDVPTLSTCNSLLRTAKMCLGPGLVNQVRVIAGVVASVDPSSTTLKEEGEENASESHLRLGLGLEQRAGLARSCRWVDEVIEGVPYFEQLDSTSTVVTSQPKAKDEGSIRSQCRREEELARLLGDIGALWTARFVREIEDITQNGGGIGSFGETSGKAETGGLILLPRF